MKEPGKRTRVLIVDDSALVRQLLQLGFESDPELEVVGTARDPYEARDLLVRLRPDVVTLDVEMPRMDGVTFLRKYMAVLPTPTIIISSLTAKGSELALAALAAGAVDVVTKPSFGIAQTLEQMMGDLVKRVKQAKGARVEPRTLPLEEPIEEFTQLTRTTARVIGIGASTGGVAALGRILPKFPAWTPGIVIVQHMPQGFTRDFAKRLDADCAMRVAEANDGDRIAAGHIFVAPGGDRHLQVERRGGEYRLRLVRGVRVSGHVPSVDVFFESLARHVGRNAAGCLLTGMGDDGAAGLLKLKHQGGRTVAQDQASSVVWGMPGAAEALGAAQNCLPLEAIPAALTKWASADP
jgi:two-component system chemotaxis response regulator CheB